MAIDFLKNLCSLFVFSHVKISYNVMKRNMVNHPPHQLSILSRNCITNTIKRDAKSFW